MTMRERTLTAGMSDEERILWKVDRVIETLGDDMYTQLLRKESLSPDMINALANLTQARTSMSDSMSKKKQS